MANSIAVTDPKQARTLGKASVGLSVSGIILTILVFLIVFVLLPFAFGIAALNLTNLV